MIRSYKKCGINIQCKEPGTLFSLIKIFDTLQKSDPFSSGRERWWRFCMFLTKRKKSKPFFTIGIGHGHMAVDSIWVGIPFRPGRWLQSKKRLTRPTSCTHDNEAQSDQLCPMTIDPYKVYPLFDRSCFCILLGVSPTSSPKKKHGEEIDLVSPMTRPSSK